MIRPRIRILFIDGARLFQILSIGPISPFKYPIVITAGKRFIKRNYISNLFTGDQQPEFKLKPKI